MFKLLFVAIFSVFFMQISNASADPGQEYFEIKSVSVEEQPIDQNLLASIRAKIKYSDLHQSPHIQDDGNPLSPINDANAIVDGIINIGAKIWKVFEASTPVVNLSMERANALPKELKDWTEMDNWSDVQAKQYGVSYKNAYGSEVVRFQLLLTYAYNGSYKNAGKYLNQVGFLVNDYYVAPLYKLEGRSEVVRVQNVGTKTAPVAGMEINLVSNISNVLFKTQYAINYYIRGDGAITVRQPQ